MIVGDDVLRNENYIHQMINYSENFVDRNIGIHTQNIERLWRKLRANIPRFDENTL